MIVLERPPAILTPDNVGESYDFYKEYMGNPVTVEQAIGSVAGKLASFTEDIGATDEIHEHVDNGGVLVMAVGPHKHAADQIYVGEALRLAGLGNVAYHTRTLGKAEYVHDYGDGMREMMQQSGMIPVYRWNSDVQRFSKEIVAAAKEPLNETVEISTAGNGRSLLLFPSGTRYTGEGDPYSDIPVKPGIEHFTHRIIRAGGNVALVNFGLFYPGDADMVTPHVHMSRLQRTIPVETGAVVEYVRGELYRVVGEAQLAARGILSTSSRRWQ